MIFKYLFISGVVNAGLLLLLIRPALHAITWFDYLPEGSNLRLLGVPAVLLVLGIIVIFIPYFTHQVTKRCVFESKTFIESLSGAIAETKFRLSFLPVIGTLFMPRGRPDTEEIDSHQKEK